MWRPNNWPKNPCEHCDRKEVDQYGFICDLPCGQHTRYFNFEAGADKMLEALRSNGCIASESLRNVPGAIGWKNLGDGFWYFVPKEKE